MHKGKVYGIYYYNYILVTFMLCGINIYMYHVILIPQIILMLSLTVDGSPILLFY